LSSQDAPRCLAYDSQERPAAYKKCAEVFTDIR